MSDWDQAAINLRRLAMQLVSQLPPDGNAREVRGYMDELIEWEGQRREDAQIIALTVAASN